MAKQEKQSLFKESPPTDELHSDGEDDSGASWFPPQGRWRFARLHGKQTKWRLSSLTRSQSTASCCCCCGPRWGRTKNSNCADDDHDNGVEEHRGGSSTKGNTSLRRFASFSDSSPLRFADGGRVSPALSPLPVRAVSKTEREKERLAFVPIWQRRATMSPIKALDLRHRAS